MSRAPVTIQRRIERGAHETACCSGRLGDDRRGVRLGRRPVHAGQPARSDRRGHAFARPVRGRRGGGAEQAFILTLPVPTCLSGGEADGAVGSTTTIHVYSFDSAVSGGVGESHRTKRAGARHAVQRAHCPSPRADRHGRELDRRDLSVSYSRCAIFFSLICKLYKYHITKKARVTAGVRPYI